MNILITISVAAFGLSLLWAAQSIALLVAGEPLALPLRFSTRKPLVRWTSRIMIHTTWVIILVGTPFARGVSPLDTLHRLFPIPVPWSNMLVAFSVVFFPSVIVYLTLMKVGWVIAEPQNDRATRRRKLWRRIVGPIPLTTLEEGVFRGVLLEQLLQSLPQTRIYIVIAVVISSVVFASVHFIKLPYPGKPIWQPAWGYFIAGCLFGVAYLIGGRSLWLPIIVHATFVFMVEVAKMYTVLKAPPWLMGYGECPQCGLVGSIFILYTAVALAQLA